MGVFDAYTEKGSNINQPYKLVKDYDITYNPYRVNVGSIGLKTPDHNNNYISPAYVVFGCKEPLLPEFLYQLFKTDTFNEIINDSTTGSVRQNLKFETLSKLKIPLPSLKDQKELLKRFRSLIVSSEDAKSKAVELTHSIPLLVDKKIGIKTKQTELLSKGEYFKATHFSSLAKWGVDALKRSSVEYTKDYPIFKINRLCDVSSGGTPSRSNQNYFKGDIPWIKTTEVKNGVIYDTEEHITEEAIKNSSAKIYSKSSLLIAMYGQGATRGRTAKLGVDASTNQACAVLHNINSAIIETDYLWVYLMNEYDRIRELASGNNQPNLNADMVKNYPVIVPPLKHQQQIVEEVFLLKETIREYQLKAKNALISAQLQFEKEIFELS